VLPSGQNDPKATQGLKPSEPQAGSGRFVASVTFHLCGCDVHCSTEVLHLYGNSTTMARSRENSKRSSVQYNTVTNLWTIKTISLIFYMTKIGKQLHLCIQSFGEVSTSITNVNIFTTFFTTFLQPLLTASLHCALCLVALRNAERNVF